MAESVVDTFYTSFAKLDGETMVDCYADEILFHDPAFGELRGERAKAMWRMLCASQQGKDFVLVYDILDQTDNTAKVRWEAFYNFSKTARQVHNKIEADIKLQHNKITHHTDVFDLFRWSRQALGLPGILLGWTPYMKSKIRSMANDRLDKYMAK